MRSRLDSSADSRAVTGGGVVEGEVEAGWRAKESLGVDGARWRAKNSFVEQVLVNALALGGEEGVADNSRVGWASLR